MQTPPIHPLDKKFLIWFDGNLSPFFKSYYRFFLWIITATIIYISYWNTNYRYFLSFSQLDFTNMIVIWFLFGTYFGFWMGKNEPK